MEDLWKRAKSFAEETAKKSQTFTLPSSSTRISDLVADTAKKSKELALEASKKADELKVAALKQADQIHNIKSFSDIIPPQLSSLSIANASSLVTGSGSGSDPVISDEELRRFGVTDDLRDFVKGLTASTFQNFPVQDEAEPADVPTTASNVRKDLTEWQERHATLVLATVKPVSRLRYELCPRVMRESRFWRIYFTLVSTHVAPYEKQYMEEVKRKAEEKDDKQKQTPVVGETEVSEKNLKSKTSAVSSAEEDLDTFLLGDLEDSDGGADDADESFGDDFDKIGNSDVEDEKHSSKAKTVTENPAKS